MNKVPIGCCSLEDSCVLIYCIILHCIVNCILLYNNDVFFFPVGTYHFIFLGQFTNLVSTTLTYFYFCFSFLHVIYMLWAYTHCSPMAISHNVRSLSYSTTPLAVRCNTGSCLHAFESLFAVFNSCEYPGATSIRPLVAKLPLSDNANPMFRITYSRSAFSLASDV